MKVGIIGPPGSGKTTLFKALTGLDIQSGGGRKTHLGTVKVPDPRLTTLTEMTDGRKVVPAEVSFSDVGGGMGKPTRDHGIEPKLLNLMSAEDAFAMVVADFDEYARPDGEPADPLLEAKELNDDLMIADLVIIENRIERMAKENAKGIERETLEKCKEHLENEKPLRTIELTGNELKAISNYGFLSQKRSILIRNIGEDKVGAPEPGGIEEYAESQQLIYMSVAAELQMEISRMDPADKDEYIQAMGLEGLVLDRFIRAAFEALDLIVFFTVGGPTKEVHAWTVRRDAHAVEAAGKIHSDIQRGFIRAEIISYDDFIEQKGEVGAKQAGKMRLEGKEYEVKDGDIVVFRFNV